MKTQYDHLNTPENKARFFALYWGLRTAIIYNSIEDHEYTGLEMSELLFDQITAIELTPLSDISNEDARGIDFEFDVCSDIELTFEFKTYDMSWLAIHTPTGGTHEGVLLLEHFDYLRSKGYALPFMGIPVEVMQAWGWLGLKS